MWEANYFLVTVGINSKDLVLHYIEQMIKCDGEFCSWAWYGVKWIMIFAITGGIGTGKSEVLKIFKKYLVFNADDISHEIINENQIITQIVDNFD